jgi:hypothetical protein
MLLLVLAALLALLGWLGWRRMGWEQVEVPAGLQGEALRNDFLAAQRLLAATGHPATCVQGLPHPLPPATDVLILPSRRGAPAPAAAARIADWVARGGLLLAEGMEPEDPAARATADPLFRAFGMRLVPAGPGDPPDTISSALPGPPLKLDLGRAAKLQPDRRQGAGGQGAGGQDAGGQGGVGGGPLRLARVPYGRGEAWLCPSLDALGNPRIREQDHPDFLCAVAALRPAGHVWILTQVEPASLWVWLRRRAWPALAALAALAAAAFWATAPRFGPLEAEPALGRRSLMEHLDACGRHQWRSSRGEPLLRASRESFRRHLGRARPGWELLDPEALEARLAQRSGLPAERIRRALAGPAPTHPGGFLEAIQTLHRLRKAL